MAETSPQSTGQVDIASLSPQERRAYLRSADHQNHPAFVGVETAAVEGSPASKAFASRQTAARNSSLSVGWEGNSPPQGRLAKAAAASAAAARTAKAQTSPAA